MTSDHFTAEINNKAMGSEVPETGAPGNFAQKNLKELKDWQDQFCEMAGIYALCLDKEGVPVSDFSGNPGKLRLSKNM